MDAYPYLLQNGYGLGFFPEGGIKDNRNFFDPRISATIEDITLDFISSVGKDVFILYHCESNDGRQANRNRLFEIWFNKSTHKEKMYKHGLVVEIKTEDDTNIYHYIGFITSSNNKNIENAIIELEAFSIDLVIENVNKGSI